jgi:hypothetical protein
MHAPNSLLPPYYKSLGEPPNPSAKQNYTFASFSGKEGTISSTGMFSLGAPPQTPWVGFAETSPSKKLRFLLFFLGKQGYVLSHQLVIFIYQIYFPGLVEYGIIMCETQLQVLPEKRRIFLEKAAIPKALAESSGVRRGFGIGRSRTTFFACFFWIEKKNISTKKLL